MPNFDWLDSVEAPWRDRYPEWVYGYENWSKQPDITEWILPRPLSWLPELGRTGQYPAHLQCPRLFISHRQKNRDEALRVAQLAHQVGFEFWLDVFDPSLLALQRVHNLLTPQQQSFATAAIIEMALLNCSHVIALITPDLFPQASQGSMWVPYEYGRVKDAPPQTIQAGCWRHPQVQAAGFPEYLYLGEITTSETQITGWLNQELSKWIQNSHYCQSGSQIPWVGGNTVGLPTF
jgi:hypothetical protein